MPGDALLVYWDSNVPLSYVNGVANRLAIIEELFKQARAGEIELVTSSVSRVEVAFVAEEKEAGQLDPAVEEKIANLWMPGSPLKTVEFFDLIGEDAKGLMRRGISQGWGALKPMDAIHLATAQRMAVSEFHTYCQHLHRWSGVLGFPVTEPQTAQTVMDVGVEPPTTGGIAADGS